ncbi:MAG: peptidylprolyl isomerase [Nitrospirota bacterium]|nr:MAG: peptidylprolyl isomerase [Nitrospirota bacterium]
MSKLSENHGPYSSIFSNECVINTNTVVLLNINGSERLKKAILLSLFMALAFGCSGGSGDSGNVTPPGEHLITVGPNVITEGDISERLSAIPEYAKGIYDGEEGFRNIVDELIKTELLYLQALKKGVDKDPEYIEMVENYKKFALVGMIFEQAIGSAPEVTDKKARDYYEKNRGDFTQPDRIKASHILLKSQAEADEVYRLLMNGGSFEDLARERSIDTNSAENGGDLGLFSRGEMSEEFEEVAFSLRKNEISKPVKSTFGFHIIKVTERKDGQTMEYKRVKDLIVQKLQKEEQQKAFEEYLKKVRKEFPVEVNEARLEELSKSYGR